MTTIRRTIDLDAATDSRLCALAARRGQDVSHLIADSIELMESAFVVEGPDVAEDERRLAEFFRTKKAISFDEMKAWTDSWGSEAELPRPTVRKIG
jgi:predicted transcriptional regulator